MTERPELSRRALLVSGIAASASLAGCSGGSDTEPPEGARTLERFRRVTIRDQGFMLFFSASEL